MTERPEVGYSPLTGTVYVLLRNGQKRPVPEPQVVSLIVSWLDDHDLVVTKDDGTRVRYEGLPESIVWATCEGCGDPIFEYSDWSHAGGSTQHDHDAQPTSTAHTEGDT